MAFRLPYREVIFGLEDSLVSTLGVVVGVAAGTDRKYVVILSALVVIVVESLSMAAGTYLSNKSQMELELAAGNKITPRTHLTAISIRDSIFMGVSYILGGIISVIPFFLLQPLAAIVPAVFISISTLFIIGYIKGQIAKINPVRSGLEMSLVSLSAAASGYLIGILARSYLMKI